MQRWATDYKVTRITSKRGFTLIETIIAVCITAVVIAIFYSLIHTIMAVLNGQERRQAESLATVNSLNTLVRDLTCAVGLVSSNCAPLILDNTNTFATLAYYTAVRANGDDPRWFNIEYVKVRVLFPDDAKRRILVRESQPVIEGKGDGLVTTNILLKSPGHFSVEVLENQTWRNKWPIKLDQSCPQAARLSLSAANTAATYTVEAIIPVQRIFSPKTTNQVQRL